MFSSSALYRCAPCGPHGPAAIPAGDGMLRPVRAHHTPCGWPAFTPAEHGQYGTGHTIFSHLQNPQPISKSSCMYPLYNSTSPAHQWGNLFFSWQLDSFLSQNISKSKLHLGVFEINYVVLPSQLPHGLPPTSLSLETEVEKLFLQDPSWLPIHDTDFAFQKFPKYIFL